MINDSPKNQQQKIFLDVLSSLKAYCEFLKLSGINYFYLSPAHTQTSRTLHEQKKRLLTKALEELGDCKRCKLYKKRRNIVFGEGNPDARLVFVGEAPGADEDIQGKPFVGKAGQLLTRIIQAINLKRSDVYIANIIKCRPPSNRDPEDDEIQTCFAFLKKQLEIIQPRIICALGRVAAQTLLETNMGITEMRGNFHLMGNIKVMPTYHPSYLLRNQAKKKEVWEDMQLVQKEYLKPDF